MAVARTYPQLWKPEMSSGIAKYPMQGKIAPSWVLLCLYVCAHGDPVCISLYIYYGYEQNETNQVYWLQVFC